MNRTSPSFLADPAAGRIYVARRLVRSTDVSSSGRLRLDALAGYLQIVAEDDLADSGLLAPAIWLVRRCVVEIGRLPRMGERITLRTFCSGTGPRWAERTTTVASTAEDLLQARAVWAAVSPASGRPVPLGEEFLRVYGEATGGRTVSARLSHPRPAPADGGRPWPLRAADFDIAGHVNNAIAWAAVEDLLADGPSGAWVPGRVDLEYQRAIMPGCDPRLATARDGQDVLMWLVDGDRALVPASETDRRQHAAAGRVLVSARLTPPA
jgi:acyl-ACP thioesterase